MEKQAKIIIYTLAALLILGLVITLTNNPVRKKFLKQALEPYEQEITQLKKENEHLLKQFTADTSAAQYQKELKAIKKANLALSDSLTKLKLKLKHDEKTVIDYGGTFDERFSEFTNNVSTAN